MSTQNRVVFKDEHRPKGQPAPMKNATITMLRDQEGAANAEGTKTRLYKAGETVDVHADLADAFVKMGVAEEVNPEFFPCGVDLDPRYEGDPHRHRSKLDAYDCLRPLLDQAVEAKAEFEAREAEAEANLNAADPTGQPGPASTPAAPGPSETKVDQPDETKTNPDQGDALANLANGGQVDGDPAKTDADPIVVDENANPNPIVVDPNAVPGGQADQEGGQAGGSVSTVATNQNDGPDASQATGGRRKRQGQG